MAKYESSNERRDKPANIQIIKNMPKSQGSRRVKKLNMDLFPNFDKKAQRQWMFTPTQVTNTLALTSPQKSVMFGNNYVYQESRRGEEQRASSSL